MKSARCTLFLLAALCSCYCSKTKLPGPHIDPALITLIPADTVTLVGLRLDILETTAVYKKYLANRDFPFVTDFAAQTKIDPRKDLWELLFLSNGKQTALLGHGKFSDESEPKLEKKGAPRFGYKGVNFVGDERQAILLLSPSTLGVGDTPLLKQIVDTKEKAAAFPPGLAALLKDMSPDAQLWAAHTGGPIPLPALQGNLANINKLMSLVQTGSIYFDFRMGISGLMMSNSASEADAQQVEGALKALVGFGRLSTPTNQPDLLKVWDQIRVTQESKQAKVHIDIPEEFVEKFLSLLPAR